VEAVEADDKEESPPPEQEEVRTRRRWKVLKNKTIPRRGGNRILRERESGE